MAGRFPKSLARELGYGECYFIVMRGHFRAKYDYICSLSEKDKLALRLYDEEKEAIRSELAEIYLLLEETRSIHDFAYFLINEGLYEDPSSVYWIQNTLFDNPKGIVKHEMFLKCKKILEVYPSWVREVA